MVLHFVGVLDKSEDVIDDLDQVVDAIAAIYFCEDILKKRKRLNGVS